MQFKEKISRKVFRADTGISLAHRKSRARKDPYSKKACVKGINQWYNTGQDNSEKDTACSQPLKSRSMRKDGSSSLPLYYCGCCTTQRSTGCGVVVGVGGDCLLLNVVINHKGSAATQLWQVGRRFRKMSSAFLAAQTVIHSSSAGREKGVGLIKPVGCQKEHVPLSHSYGCSVYCGLIMPWDDLVCLFQFRE